MKTFRKKSPVVVEDDELPDEWWAEPTKKAEKEGYITVRKSRKIMGSMPVTIE